MKLSSSSTREGNTISESSGVYALILKCFEAAGGIPSDSRRLNIATFKMTATPYHQKARY